MPQWIISRRNSCFGLAREVVASAVLWKRGLILCYEFMARSNILDICSVVLLTDFPT